ncbi:MULTISPECIES: hypothetical protein [unclassified Sporosarcina]|uniref:hypothetical protein n=1 Tax=unclassified Sporosarcina TaxID=2647733 RepID=UPI001A930078|nr:MULTISPECIES: hypothetical protein [unclassified Sporosarcina]MBO0587599.1 hypothetical protein [Sporosarcina sp. E16_8]MBO0602413.1 hypothetical protein [Sporosarcina sp. E16_3]
MSIFASRFGLVLILFMLIVSGCQSVDSNFKDIKEIEEELPENEIFTEENGFYYIYGVTLNDSKSRVIEKMGKEFKEIFDSEVNVTGADSILEYSNSSFHFYREKLIFVMVEELDVEYYDNLFIHNNDKYVNQSYKIDKYNSNSIRYFYSKDTSQILMAKYDPDRNLTIMLTTADDNFYESLKAGAIEEILDNAK